MDSHLIDVEGGLRRNGNNYLFYMRHLQRFLNDTNMVMSQNAGTGKNL